MFLTQHCISLTCKDAAVFQHMDKKSEYMIMPWMIWQNIFNVLKHILFSTYMLLNEQHKNVKLQKLQANTNNGNAINIILQLKNLKMATTCESENTYSCTTNMIQEEFKIMKPSTHTFGFSFIWLNNSNYFSLKQHWNVLHT